MKVPVFIDTRTRTSYVQFPSDLDRKQIKAARLVWWNVEGIDQGIDEDTGLPTRNFYIQVKFTGLDYRVVATGARPDMIQLPITSFGGWGISPHPIDLCLSRTQQWLSRLTIEVHPPGEQLVETVPPTPFIVDPDLFRLCLWLELDME